MGVDENNKPKVIRFVSHFFDHTNEKSMITADHFGRYISYFGTVDKDWLSNTEKTLSSIASFFHGDLSQTKAKESLENGKEGNFILLYLLFLFLFLFLFLLYLVYFFIFIVLGLFFLFLFFLIYIFLFLGSFLLRFSSELGNWTLSMKKESNFKKKKFLTSLFSDLFMNIR